MSEKCHIEQLREMLGDFALDAPNLYRYGSLSGSLDILARLNKDDKRRLVLLGLLNDDRNVVAVARELMKKLEPKVYKLE